MTIPLKLRMFPVAAVCVVASSLAGAQQPSPTAPPRRPAAASAASSAASPKTAPLTATIPVDPQITTGQFAERTAVLHPHEQKPETARRAAARRQRRLDPRRRRSAGPGALRRAHGVQRHEELSRAGDGQVPRVDRHALRRRRQRVHELRRDRLQLEVPTDKPDVLDKAFLILEDWAHNVSFDPAEIDKERGVDHRGVAAAPRRRRAHAGQAVSRSCSRDRATPSGCRSARWRSSRASSTSA